jgi:hypothetical protein
MSYHLIQQVFIRNAFLNRDYFEEFVSKYNQIYKKQLKTIDTKFEDISNSLWSISNPLSHYFQKYRKLNGIELRQYYKQLRDELIVTELGLPRMVTLPVREGCISDKKLDRLLSYGKAMNVYEGDEDTIVKHKGYEYNRAEAYMLHMYVNEYYYKFQCIRQLISVKEEYNSNYYHQYERNFHYILEYQNKSTDRREKANALFLESLSSQNDHNF